MKSRPSFLIFLGLLAFLMGCDQEEHPYDASGAFEAVETIISAEVGGPLLAFELEEGQEVKAGQFIGYIDSTQLHLKKRQLQEQIKSMLSKKPNVGLQLSALQAQLSTARTEQQRLEKLVAAEAAPSKHLDDVNAQIAVIQNQMAALRSSLTITSEGISNDANTLQLQIAQLDDQIRRCRLVSPMQGTVLTTFARKNEMAAPGKPLYKVADLSTMELRAYLSGDQLAQVRLNQPVKVYTDDGKGGMAESEGTITWISSKGEFTPKTIQTKNERANMVYAIKVRVANDGRFKIGMYGEIKL